MPEKSQTIIVDESRNEIIQALAFGTLQKINWLVKYAGENRLVAYTPQTWKKRKDEILIETSSNQLTIKSKLVHGEMMDLAGKNKKHIKEFLEVFNTVKATRNESDIQNWQSQITELKSYTTEEAEKQQTLYKEADQVMNFSTGNMYVTYAIMGINVAVFILMVIKGVDIISPKPVDVLKWGASMPGLTLAGDWWRLITSTFLHFGIIHLALNMYALYFIGSYLEPMLGKTRYIVAYLCAGVGASIVSVLWHKNEIIVSAGASGAIFGMFGVFLALLMTNIIPKHIKGQLMQSILIFVAYNVFYGFKAGSMVDNSAHLGGLATGMLIGGIYYFSFKEPTGKKLQIVSIATIALTAVVTFFVVNKEKLQRSEVNFSTEEVYSANAKKYLDKFKSFGEYEEKALSIDRESDTLSREEMLDKLQNIALPAWKDGKKEIEEAGQYAENDKQKEILQELQQYGELRIKFTDLRIRALKENTRGYDNEIEEVGKQIQAILAKLNAPQEEEKPKE